MKSRKKLFLTVLMLLAISIPLSATAQTVALPNDIAWVYASDTYLGCVQQAYLNAINRLGKLAEGKKPGTWCVVLDADETVISNVKFQAEQAAVGAGYSKDAWNAWCERMEATALPGAIEFLNEVKKLGGKIIIVTNRQAPLSKPTIKNLEKIDMPFDLCLLREGVYKDDRSKVQRRVDIEKGTLKSLPLGQRLPPLEILMLAGDQIHDIYEDETFDQIKERYGKDLIIIPNPMYGDWVGANFQAPARRLSPGAVTSSRTSGDQTVVTWQEAMEKVDQTVTVEAEILRVYDPATRNASGPVKLNTARDWATSLTIVLFNKDGQFGDPARFEGKTIRATGKVSVYREATQLTVYGPNQIEIID